MRTIIQVLLLFSLLPIFACNTGGGDSIIEACPPGTQAKGSLPPNGQETWCEKIVDGQPVKDGPFVLYRPEGSLMMRGHYHDGKQDGEWTMWYDNGQKASIDHYKGGVQDGEHIGWYTNGKIAATGQYKDGKKEGVWKRWDAQGFRNWEETYKSDQRIS